MRLILVRHGETELNVKNLIGGQAETKLSAKGIKQVELLDNKLKLEKINYIYISPLIRTKQTAQPILQKHIDAKVIYDKRLMERSWGEFDGKTIEEYNESWKNSKKEYLEFVPKNGESIKYFKNRIINFTKELLTKHKDGTILIVGHGGTVLNIMLYLLKDTDENYKKYWTGNASISIIELNEEKEPKMEVFNSTTHLEP